MSVDISTYHLTIQDLQWAYNYARSLTVNELVRTGYLTAAKAEEFEQRHAIVIIEKGRIGKWWDRFFKKDSKETVIFVEVDPVQYVKEKCNGKTQNTDGGRG